MRALLLPVKDLRNAKQRLAGVLTPEERFGLASAMLTDTIRAVRGVRQADRIFVVTNYGPAMQAARENGWEILLEERQISESVSVDAASRQCEERGATGVLRLPLDVPLVEADDIDELLAVGCSVPALVIVPSRDGTGTNAILVRPPLAVPYVFGPDSLQSYIEAARQRHLRYSTYDTIGMALDVDTIDDLDEVNIQNNKRKEIVHGC